MLLPINTSMGFSGPVYSHALVNVRLRVVFPRTLHDWVLSGEERVAVRSVCATRPDRSAAATLTGFLAHERGQRPSQRGLRHEPAIGKAGEELSLLAQTSSLSSAASSVYLETEARAAYGQMSASSPYRKRRGRHPRKRSMAQTGPGCCSAEGISVIQDQLSEISDPEAEMMLERSDIQD
jgi:hypothetical protein